MSKYIPRVSISTINSFATDHITIITRDNVTKGAGMSRSRLKLRDRDVTELYKLPMIVVKISFRVLVKTPYEIKSTVSQVHDQSR